MGTNWKLRFQAEARVSLSAVRTTVEAAIHQVVETMSHWDPDSALSRFNRAPAATWHALPEGFFHVLQRAVEIADLSDGAFDPTLGRLVDLHGFGPSGPVETLPHPTHHARAKAEAGYQRLFLDPPSRSVLQPGGCQLDLSSIAKGYAVDLASQALLHSGIHDFALEIGGELRGHGCKPDGQPWWIGLEAPDELPSSLFALCGLSIATSGDTYLRRPLHREKDATVCHLIDPGTGKPTCHPILSVTVAASLCMEADAWATALYVAGPKNGPALAEKHQLAALFFLRSEHGYRQWLSPQMKDFLS
nr:FAD:protein FMN transferase [Haloferula luteola]